METLASVWTRDPCDFSDLGEKSSVWESECDFTSSPPAGQMWPEQLSPHLQRNKQLQDTLLQREEQLARLQDENNKLREFLNSSFVRNLEQKAKKLTADGRRKLKRNLMHVDDGPFQNHSHQLVTSQQVSKRVCRNLTAEFCSESSETSSSSEPNLDLWVLRTLGLKDRDTIDTSNNSSSSSSGYSLGSLVYDASIASSSSSEYTLNSSFSPPVAPSTPSSVQSYCQRSTQQTDCRYSAESNCGNPAESPQNGTNSLVQRSDFTASALTGQYEAPAAVIRSYHTFTAFQSPLLTEELPFTQSEDQAEICSITASSQVQTLEEIPAKHPTYWSPPGDRVPFSPISSSSPVIHQQWTPVSDCSPTSPSAEVRKPPATPQMPRSRTDLAFSMSLSPSSSVKTHSFPQGQAFVRKDTGGRWNFTWVPRQGP
ncbi:geminin coiled-coil domain-containing protein 1 [Sander vitreus]